MSQPRDEQRHDGQIQSTDGLHVLRQQQALERRNSLKPEWKAFNTAAQLEAANVVVQKRTQQKRAPDGRNEKAQAQWEAEMNVFKQNVAAKHAAQNNKGVPSPQIEGRRHALDSESIQKFTTSIREFGAHRSARVTPVLYGAQPTQDSRE